MSEADMVHSYELIFVNEGVPQIVAFEALDRTAIFADYRRIAGDFQIWEDGLLIGQAHYSTRGQFWLLWGKDKAALASDL